MTLCASCRRSIWFVLVADSCRDSGQGVQRQVAGGFGADGAGADPWPISGRWCGSATFLPHLREDGGWAFAQALLIDAWARRYRPGWRGGHSLSGRGAKPDVVASNPSPDPRGFYRSSLLAVQGLGCRPRWRRCLHGHHARWLFTMKRGAQRQNAVSSGPPDRAHAAHALRRPLVFSCWFAGQPCRRYFFGPCASVSAHPARHHGGARVFA